MKLLTLKQTSCRQTDTVFGTPSLGTGLAALFACALLGVDICFLVYGRIDRFSVPRVASGCTLPVFLLIAWALFRKWQAERRPTNWLVRLNGNDVLIKFRTFENWRMSEDDIQVIELNRDEIAAVRQRQEQQVTKDMDRKTVFSRRAYIELVLKDRDTSSIEKALADERALPGWGSTHHHTKVLNYPVSAADGVITLTWRSETSSIRPRMKPALAAFARMAPLADAISQTADFTPTALRKLEPGEQRKRIAELAQRDQLAALETTKELYNCSLAKATQILQDLTTKE